MRILLLAAAFAVAAISAGPLAPAAAQPAAATASAAATAPQWRVDGAKSSLGFSSAVNGSAFKGSFQRWSADIRFDPANLAGSRIRVVVEPASARADMDNAAQSMQAADWFDSARHTQVIFQSTNIRATGPGRYEAAGTLTVKGRAVPVTLPFTLTIGGAAAEAQGTVALDRVRLGLGTGYPAATIPTAVSVSFRVSATRV